MFCQVACFVLFWFLICIIPLRFIKYSVIVSWWVIVTQSRPERCGQWCQTNNNVNWKTRVRNAYSTLFTDLFYIKSDYWIQNILYYYIIIIKKKKRIKVKLLLFTFTFVLIHIGHISNKLIHLEFVLEILKK